MAMGLEERSYLRYECMKKFFKSKYWRLVNYNRELSYKFVSSGVLYNHLVHSVCADPSAPKFGLIKWVGEAEQRYRRRPPPPEYGVADRVLEIVFCLMPPPPPLPPEVVVEDDEYDLAWKEGLLDELLAYDILSIDVATVLHSKGCLFSFLGHLLSNKHACIRAKAAEVITTMVQDSRTNQKLLLEGKVLQLLLHTFTSYLDDSTLRIKILVAISALFEENEDVVIAFGREKGYAALRKALISESSIIPMSDLFRKVLDVIQCLLLETRMYHLVRDMELDMHLNMDPDLEVADPSEVREVSLISLLLLEGIEGGNSCQLVNDYIKLKHVQRRHWRSMMKKIRTKSCFRISHLLLFKNKTYHCSKKAKNNSRSKRMKLH